MATPKAKFEITAKDKSRGVLKKLRSRIDKVKGSVFSLKTGVAGLVGAAGLGALIVKSFKTVDSLAKTADILGVTTSALAGLQHAADLTGVAQSTLTKSLIKQQKAIFDADRGLATYKQHFDALGLSTTELLKLSPDQQFVTIAEALNKVENQTKKTAIAYDIFGGKGTALINTVALGRAGLAAAADEASILGLSISRIDAAKIEMANDSFTRVKATVAGLGNAVSAELAPFIEAVSKSFVDAAKQAGGMSNFVSKGMVKVIGSISSVADVVRGLQVVWLGLKVVAIGAISAIITGLDELNRAGANGLSWIPGLDIKPSSSLSEWAEISRLVLFDAQAQMKSLAMQEMPSANIQTWAADIQFEMQKAATAIAKTKSGITKDPDESGGTVVDAAAMARAEAQAKQLTKSVNAIQQSLLTEEQRTAESYLRRQQMVSNAFSQKLIDQESRDSILLGLATQHEAQKTRIAEQAEADRRAVLSAGLGAAANIFSSLGALMGRAGKKQNAMQKTLARAGIVASTAQAVMNALAVPPYPLGVALAAGAALQGAQQLRQVGGGGGGGSIPSVSSPAAQSTQAQPIPQQPLSGGAQEIRIVVDWADGTPDQIDQLADSLAKNMANGGRSPVAA